MDRQVFDQALARADAEPDSFDANHQAALLAIEFGESQRATSYLIRSYNLDPTRTEILEKLRGLLGQKEFERVSARLPPAPKEFWKDALLAFLFPFHPKMLAMVLLCGALFFGSEVLVVAMLATPSIVIGFGFGALFFAAVGVYSFVLYRVIESTALYRGFTVSLVAGSWVEALEFGIRMLLALAICFGPCLIASSHLPHPAVFYPLFLIGLIYFPMQLLCIFLCEQIRDAIKPKNVFRLMLAAPGHYLVVVSFFSLATIPGMIYDLVMQPPPEQAILVLIPHALVTTFFLFVMARGLGALYLHHRRDYVIEEAVKVTETAVVEPAPILPPVAAPLQVKESKPVASGEMRAKFDEARNSALQNSEDVDALVLAGTLGLEIGERSEAINFLAKAYRLDPSKKFVYDRLRSMCDEQTFQSLHLLPPAGDFKKDLWTAFSYPWRGAVRIFIPGLLFFVTAGIAMNLIFELLVPVLWMVLAGYSILTLMEITRVTAIRDEDHVTWAEFVDVIHCLAAFFKFGLAFLVAFFPAILASIFLSDVWLWIFLPVFALLGAIYFPMALLAACFYNTVFAVFRPLLVIRSIARIGRHYFLFLLVAAGLTLIPWAALIGSTVLSPQGNISAALVALVTGAIGHASWLYSSIVTFRALGLLYRDHRIALEWE